MQNMRYDRIFCIAGFVIGKLRVTAGGIICRISNGFPLSSNFRALPVTELD